MNKHSFKYLSPAAYQRNQQQKKTSKKVRPFYFDSALSSNSNYMNVIKESHESIRRRTFLDLQKRRILDMEFTNKNDAFDMSNLNNFIAAK